MQRGRVVLILCFVATILFVMQQTALGVAAVLFGDTSVETSQDSNSAGSAEAFQVTASAGGTLGALEVYLDSSSRASQLFVGLYTNAGGNPGVLLAQGSSTTLQAGAWNSVSVPVTNVTTGTVYWIAILGTGGTLYFRDSNTGGCSSFSSSQTNLTGLPSTWSSGSRWPSCKLSAYGVPDPTQPILSFSPASIVFSATQGGASPNSAQVAVTNAGGGALSFTDSTDSTWLGVSATSGTAPQILTVSANVSGMAAGTYTGHVTLTDTGAQGSPGTVTVTFTVATPPPPPTPTVSSLSPASATAGGSAFTLIVNGNNFVSGDTVLWNGSTLTTAFASATQLSATVSSTLIASSGSSAVSVQAPGGTTSNSVSFAIAAPAPTVSSLSPSSATAGGSAFTLTVNGNNFVSGDTVLWNGSALTATFVSATKLTAAVSSTLIATSGSAAVSVKAPGGSTSSSLSFTINSATPQLSVSPTTLSFSGTQGSSSNPGPSSLSVTNSGNGSLTFTASSDSTWLSVTPASGTAPQSLQISVVVGTLTVGTYTGHITVTAAGAQNSPASIPVTFTVAADAPPVISNAGASSITAGGAVITWTTDKASSSQVNYGATTAYGTSSMLQTSLVTSHTVSLSGLTAGTLYHYQTQSADAIGTVGTSADLTFTTTSTSSSCPCSIWSSTTIPGTPSVNDSNAVELGVKFTSSVTGYITSIRFYKSSQNTGTHTGTLWTSTGTSLATATFTGETSSGWQQVNFASPVAIAANITYVASYHTSEGYYAGDTQFFATSAVNQPPLQALANGPSGGNGVYVYGTGGVFPKQTYESTNYWVDVVFNPTQTLPAAYGISGTITGGSGATVTLSGAASATTTAGGSGNFSFSGLANGSYTVTPSKTGFTFSPTSQSAAVNGANVTGVAFTATAITQTFSVSGTITGGSGATVTLSGAASATTTANASGNYTFSGLANGSYTVTPSEAGFTMSPASQSVTVNGASLTAVNFTATAQTFSVSGTLSPTAGGSGASVTLSGPSTATTTASSSGTYSFTGLANGRYAVSPSNAGYSFSPTSQAVTINGTNVTGVNFTATTVAPTYTLSGTISPASSGAGSVVTLSGAASFSTTADSSGNYSFTALANGAYTVTPSSSTATFSPTSQAVSISSGNVSGVNFTATATANVIFFDDFLGSTLSSQWIAMNRHGDYSNSELQCYLPANVTVSGGYLNILTEAQTQTCGDSDHAPSTWNYTSGMVQWDTFNFTYGTVEFRAKTAGGSGSWPAVWMLGYNCQASNILSADNVGACNWPQPGSDEIDILEMSDNNYISVGHDMFVSSGGQACFQNASSDTSQNWHVYTMTWKAGSVTYAIDGVVAGCSHTSGVPTTPMFLIINNAISPNWSVVASTFPQTMQIDYVKVTQP
jgi:beta-glucanase (GH16 family)